MTKTIFKKTDTALNYIAMTAFMLYAGGKLAAFVIPRPSVY